MKPAPDYVADVDPAEHPNTVVMAGALHTALALTSGQLDVRAEVLDGQVTGRLIVAVPFLRSPDVDRDTFLEFVELGEDGDGAFRLAAELVRVQEILGP